MGFHLSQEPADVDSFLGDEPTNGLSKGRVADPVSAERQLGEEPTRNFVLALGACFEEQHLSFDGPLKWLIIAEFEMQVPDLFDGTPIPTVEARSLFVK